MRRPLSWHVALTCAASPAAVLLAYALGLFLAALSR